MSITKALGGPHKDVGRTAFHAASDGWLLVTSGNLSVIQELGPSGCSDNCHFHIKAK